jgi:glycogen synthase
MNIAFLDFDDIRNPLLGAGQAKATVEVGSRLVKMGHSVMSLCSAYPGATDRTENGIFYKHIGWGTGNIRLNNLIFILSVPYALIQLKADLIVECFTAPMSTLCAPLFTKIPVVALPTSFDAERFTKQYHLPFSMFERFCLRFYRYFLPYTRAYEQKMRKYNKNITAKIVPEGVGEEFFRINPKPPEYILFLGRIEINQKGIDMLLSAYSRIYPKTRYPLVIAGKGPDEAKMKELINKYGLDNRVTFTGPAYGRQKYRLLEKALYVAMPSRNEGFSLFSLEALASGLPLVTYDIDGFSWTTDQPVIKAKPFDVADYARIMLECTKPGVIARLRSRARKSVVNYSWDHVASEFEIFFKYVLNIHNAGNLYNQSYESTIL